MKRLYILIISIILLTSGWTSAQSIITFNVPATLCANESFSLSYSVNLLQINSGNVFTVELSDNTGLFPGQDIGSIVSTNLSGEIYVTLPSQPFTFSSTYRIRVKASNTGIFSLPFIGSDNGFDIDINCTTRDYYWLGGSGNWSDLSKWEYTTDDITYTPATELPTANDNVIFDDSTFPSGGQLTVDVIAYCNDFYWDPISAANNPIIFADFQNDFNVRGDFILSNGVYREIHDLFFNSEKHNIYLDFADNLHNESTAWWKGFVDFYAGGSWDFGSDLIAENIGIYDNSTVNTEDFQLDLNREIYLSFGTLNAGFSDIYTTGVGLYSTFNAENSTFYFRTNNYGWVPYLYGSQTYNDVIISDRIANVNSDNNYSNLSLINGGGMNIWSNTHQAISSSFIAQGGDRGTMATIKSETPGIQHTFNIGVGVTVTADFVAITDSEILGSAAPYSATNGINGGNNLNWNISTLTPLAYYWVGGTGNWSDMSHWATADGGSTFHSSAPGPLDDVFFTSNSFPSGGTVTIDQIVYINDMTWQSGSGLTGPTIYSPNEYRFTMYGDLAFDIGVVRNIRQLYVNSSQGGNTLTFADEGISQQGDIFFEGGGIINLNSDVYSTNFMRFNDATVNTNGFEIKAHGYEIYNQATVNFGSSIINLDYYWYQDPSATVDYGTSTLIMDRDCCESEIYGTTAFKDVIIRGGVRLYESNSFENLTVEPGGVLLLQNGRTQTVSSSLNLTGTRSSFATIDVFNGSTSTIDVTGATVTADFVDISNNTITPASSAVSGVDGGNNVGWTIGPLPTLDFYWVGGSGDWTYPAHWATTDGGSTLHGFAPGSIDNAIFTSNSFPSGGTITINQNVTINDVSWATGSGDTNAEFFADWGNRLTVTGNFTMANGVTRRVREITFDSGNGSNQINMADNTLAQGNIEFIGGGSWELMSDLVTTNDVYFQDGTLNTNDYNMEFGGGYVYNDAAIMNWGNSTITVNYGFRNYSSSATFNAQTSTFVFANPNDTYVRGPFAFNNVVTDNVLTFEENFDNTIVNLTANPGSTIRIFAGSTQTVTGILTLVGTRNTFVTVESWDYGSPGNGNFDVTGATVLADFVDISNNTVTPVSTITSGIDGGGNIGWSIGPLPALDFYWINGTGNWSDITHWETSDDGGATFTPATGSPGPVDNVFFTSNSFPSGGTVTIGQTTTITNMTWEPGSGSTNPEIFANWDEWLIIRGDLTMDNGVRRQVRRLYFDSSDGINNISMADNYETYGDIIFEGGGTWNLLDSLYCGASMSINEGTLVTNNNAVTANFSISINSDLSVINWGSSNVYLYSGFYNFTTSATLDFGTSVFYFGNEWNGTTYIVSTQSVTNFNEVRAFSPLQIEDYNVFEKLSLVPGGELILENGTTQTVNSELSLLGSRSQLVKISSINPGLQATLSVIGATVSADYIDVQDNIIDNGVSSDVTATNTIDGGNNTGWILEPLSALDLYWIGGSGNFTDPTHWSYSDGGVANIDGFAPGALDNAIFTTNSFPDIGQVTINQSVTINNMTWELGSGLNNPVIYGDYNNTLTIQGNITMDDGVNRRIYGLRIDSSNGTNLVDLADNFNAEGDIRFIGGGVSDLMSDVATTNYFVVDGATLNTNDFTLNLWALQFEGDNSIVNLGNSNVYIYGYFNDYGNNITLNAGTSTIYFERPENYGTFYSRMDGDNDIFNFNNVVISENIEIRPESTYNSLVINPGITLRLFAGRTQTINNGGTLDIIGSRSGLITLESFDYGTPGRGVFTVTGATVTADFVRIKDNIIDNGLAANVLATNAVDLGNNIGWDYTPISALDYYWVNGPGDWSDITHWQTSPDGGSTFEATTDPPGAVDNVFFTATSFPDGGALLFDIKPEVYNMTWEPGSGANFPVLQENGQNNELIINGSLQMANGVTRSFYRLVFASDDMGNTISMADNLYGYGDIDFTGSGEWTLLDSLAINYLNLRGGTLNTNGQPVRIQDQLYLDWQNNGTVNWGASNVYLRRIWNDAQNLTFNAQTSTFNFNGIGNEAAINGNYVLNFNDVKFSGQAVINDSYSFNNVNLAKGVSLKLQAGSTQTIATSLTGVGDRGQMIQITSSNPGNVANLFINTIGGATVNLEYALIQDNALDNGDGDPLTEEIAASSVDNGGNSGWDFLTSPLAPLDFYWIGGTGNWSDTTHWATTDNGATNHLTPPGVIDNVFFTSSSFPASGTVTLDQPASCNDMTWSDGSFSPSIFGNFENRLTIRGNLTIANGVNRNLEYIEFVSDNNNLLTLGDNRYDGYSEFIFKGTGSWSLLDSMSVTNLNVFSGTINTLNNPVNIQQSFNLLNEGSIGFDFGSSNIRARYVGNYASVANVTANSGTSTFIMTNGGYLDGGEMSFYNLTIEGSTTVYNLVTVTNDLNLMPGSVFRLSPDNPLTIGNLNAVGTRPKPVTLNSWDESRQATISSAGIIVASDIAIQNSNAIGGAVFNATEAIDKGFNTGWNFSAITPIDFFWSGGSGDWSDISNWQSLDPNDNTLKPAIFAPGAVDNVTVDAIFTSAGTINLDLPVECNNMEWSAGLTGSAISGDFNTPLTIHGSLTLSSGVSTELSRLIFDSDSTGNTINLFENSGNPFIQMTFRGSGDWTLADSLSTYQLGIESGTLSTSNYPLNVEYLDLYGNGTATLNLGSSDVYINTLDGNPNNATLSTGTSTLYFEDFGRIYGSWTFNNVDIDAEMTITDNNVFNNLTLYPGSILNIGENDTLRVTDFDAVGLRSRPIYIQGTEAGKRGAIMQTSGVVLGSYLTIQDNNATGGALFVAQNSINNGNNSGWTINSTTPRDYYWVGGSGKWSEFDSHWSNTDGGNQFFDSSPGPIDNVFFTSNSFPSGGVLTLDFPISVNNIDWTGSISSVSITDDGDEDNSLTVGGDFILANGVSRDFNDLFLISNDAGNIINTADNLSSRNYIYLLGDGEWSLMGDLDTYFLSIEGGTFNSNNQDIDATFIYLWNDNISNWGSSNVTTRRFYSQYLNSSSTFKSETSTFQFDQQALIRGANRFFNVNINADAYFYDNNIIINSTLNEGTLFLLDNQSFSNLTVAGGSTITLDPATIQTVNLAFNLNGTALNPVVINSFVEGEPAFFTVPATGVVSADFVHLKDNTANSGGATFNTTNSSNFGNVSGWLGLLTGQTIDFGSLDDRALASGGFSVGAFATSGLNVSFEISSGNATASGSTITPSGSGLIGIRATQLGDGTFGSAKPFVRYVHIDATDDPSELGPMKQAKIAIGQPNEFESGEFSSDRTTPQPWKTAVSSTGKLAIAHGTRVLIWDQIPESYDTPADVVVGYNDFDTDFSNTVSASSFYEEVTSVHFTQTDQMIVTDSRGVLIFNAIPNSNGASANVIIGQTNFTSTREGTGADRFGGNVITATTYFDNAQGKEIMIVTDYTNSRVLIYNDIPTTNGVSADVVIGQNNFDAKATGAGASQLNFPTSATAYDGRLLIADYSNNRVVVYNSIPTSNGAPADFILGQPGFGFSESGTTPTQFWGPTNASISRTGKLAIADYINNRVLVYNSIPTSSTTPPDIILGQPDGTSREFNFNSLSGRTMNRPIGITWDISQNLFVSDLLNNRVLLYGAADLEGPVIESFTAPSTHPDQGIYTISDRSGVNATVHFRGISSADPADPFNMIPMNDNGDGTYSFTTEEIFPAGELLGIEYGLEIRDGYNNTSPIVYEAIPLSHSTGLAITNFGVGSTTESYRMFSVPSNLVNKDANTVFDEITQGTYDNTKLRIFSYPGGTGPDYTEYGSGMTNLELGKGYFALAAAAAAVNSGAGFTPSVTAATPFEISLVSGWNMIGNPYNFDVVWSEVLTESGLTGSDVQAPKSYTGSTTWPELSNLPAGEGVFVFSNGANTLKIPVRNNSGGRFEGIAENNTNPLFEDNWEVMLFDHDGKGNKQILGGIGMAEYAEFSFDENDRINLPKFGEYPQIEFNHPEFFMTSFRRDVRTTAAEEKWTFKYEASVSDEAKSIHWDNSYFGENAPDIYLVDKSHLKVVNMQEESSYTFPHGGTTEFEIYFGMDAYEQLRPDNLVTITPYPNPFTDKISINVGLPANYKDGKVIVAIYNTLGKQVATLNTYIAGEAYMEFIWQGNNDSGHEVPDGVYAYRVLIDGSYNEYVSGKIVKE